MSSRKKPKIIYIDRDREAPSSEPEEVVNDVPEVREAEPVVETAPPVENETEPVAPAGPPPARRPSMLLTLVFAAIAMVVLAAFIFIPIDDTRVPKAPAPPQPNCLGIQPDVAWGHAWHEMNCSPGIMERGERFADLLLSHNVNYKQVIALMETMARRHFPEIRPGDDYQLMHPPGKPNEAVAFVYEPDPATFVLLNLQGSPAVHMQARKIVDRSQHQSDIVIRTNLADAMYNREAGLKLARSLEAAIKWKVDLFHLEPGDQFRLLYEELDYEGGDTEIGQLQAVAFRHGEGYQYAFWYQDGYVEGYFDREGRAMKSGFLQAPVEYTRISSPYNLKRLDPLKSGRIMAHLGTDYAAPTGTPIVAVADGIVMKAEFKGNNGNYVKILHTKEIQTQYLHMRNFAAGIAVGTEVKQGQVIGYVGMTGRATGPHVCFRYWKNGQQVDHRKEKNFGAAPPLNGAAMMRFEARRDSLMELLQPL